MIRSKRHKKNVKLTLLIAFLFLVVVFVISVATGYISLSPSQLVRTLFGQGTDRENLILYSFRLPRIMITILAGMGLAIAGAILQSITKNPLAEPGILGINAGAGLAVVFYVMYFSVESTMFLYTLPIFAFIGGMVTAMSIYFLAFTKGEGSNPTKIVLVGVGMAAAINGLILTIGSQMEREEYDFLANWLAGRIWGNDWTFVLSILPWLLILLPIVYYRSNVLNIFNLHEHVSIGVGTSIEKERLILMAIAVALASASVAVSGGVAFVGLMAPHMARSLIGRRHQHFLPLVAILGAIFLLGADTIGRVVFDPIGIPAGIVVAMIGAPYFMYLLAKK